MGRIVISYRRGETTGEARWLFNEFAMALGKHLVFVDVERDALAVLIGNDWLDGTGSLEQRRLDDPGDRVRREIEAALARNIPITPVLLNGAQMPRAEQLPDSIRELAYCDGFELSHDRWESDVHDLLKRLGLVELQNAWAIGDVASPEKMEAFESDPEPEPEPEPERPRSRSLPASGKRRRFAMVGGVALALVIVGGAFLRFSSVAVGNRAPVEMVRSERRMINMNSRITLRSADDRYVVNARSADGYYYASLGGTAQVMVLEASNEALVGGSSVRIKTTEKWDGDWAGRTYLGAFGDKAELYFWDYYGAKTHWIIEKVTGQAGEPIFSGEKVYLQNERFTGQYMTTHPNDYLTTTNRTPRSEWTIEFAN